MRNIAIVYARLSSLAGDELSIERQIDLCTAEAQARGWSIEVLQEPVGQRLGRSNNNPAGSWRDRQRPAWRQMLERVRNDPNLAAVVVADLFRASRSVRGMAEFLELCQKRGVVFVPLKEKEMFDMKTAGGKAMVNMLTVLGQVYSDDSSRRVKTFYWHLKRSNAWVGKAPQGLKLEGRGTERHPVASKEAYRAEGKSRTYLETVRAFFRLYVGVRPIGLYLAAVLLTEKGYRVRTNAGTPKKPDRGILRQMLESVRAYRGVLPESLIEQVERRVLERKHRSFNGRRLKLPPALGWGVIYCATCHRKYYLARQQDRTYYRHDRGDCADEQWIHHLKIDNALLDLVARSLVLSDENKRKVAEHMSRQEKQTAASAESLRSQLKRLELGYVKGILNEETYVEQRRELTQEIEDASAPRDRPRNAQEILMHLDDLAVMIGRIRSLDPYLANRLLRDIFLRVEVQAAKIVRYSISPQLQPLFTTFDAVSQT